MQEIREDSEKLELNTKTPNIARCGTGLISKYIKFRPGEGSIHASSNDSFNQLMKQIVVDKQLVNLNPFY